MRNFLSPFLYRKLFLNERFGLHFIRFFIIIKCIDISTGSTILHIAKRVNYLAG
ncbi:hypothetical protein HMPREF0495_01073 [Levilactobacillus brevis ATCC 14869 = DSM 20054]|uniref:Uncharacterized protein n=1 Tax=Levilactobacillus brevis ATCC 14869 = DSM 20054 TaxID=649758 RepID=U2QSH0_LEVBR|nr:hypothetical protein HMPREF0495_01073 [Levilactobacillus brevis ATCC 14869 = DSM 20054]